MKKKLLILLVFIIIATAIVSLIILKKIAFTPNITQTKRIYIPTNANYSQVLQIIKNANIIKNFNTLEITMKLRKYPHLIKPGSYILKKNMTNWQIVNKLRAGAQDPIHLTFNNIRTKKQLASIVSKQLEADSSSIIKLLNNDSLASVYGFNKNNFLAMFIPNTYQFYWNTDAQKFIARMHKEYQKFWTQQRLQKAKQINLSPAEVIILASIVQAEQQKHPEERAMIASVYLNRLKKNMPLEADPTIIYAIGDFTIKRVLKKMLEINSPYNTYKHTGLPPGPILTPDVVSIDAVLNAPKTNYLYFCAKDDFSGYHYFSTNYKQHLYYARKYQQTLNKKKIFN